MTDELGTILGLTIPVVLSVVGIEWRMGRVDGRLAGIERSVERVQVDAGRLRRDVNGLRDDVEVILLRSSARVR